MNAPELTLQQRDALDRNHGFVQGSSYVLMSMTAYRELMGLGADEELDASLKAIAAGLADFEAGRTLSVEEATRRLDQK